MQTELIIAHLWAHIFRGTINFALIGFYVASSPLDTSKILLLDNYLNPLRLNIYMTSIDSRYKCFVKSIAR